MGWPAQFSVACVSRMFSSSHSFQFVPLAPVWARLQVLLLFKSNSSMSSSRLRGVAVPVSREGGEGGVWNRRSFVFRPHRVVVKTEPASIIAFQSSLVEQHAPKIFLG